jgi:hypothetical protein
MKVTADGSPVRAGPSPRQEKSNPFPSGGCLAMQPRDSAQLG